MIITMIKKAQLKRKIEKTEKRVVSDTQKQLNLVDEFMKTTDPDECGRVTDNIVVWNLITTLDRVRLNSYKNRYNHMK